MTRPQAPSLTLRVKGSVVEHSIRSTLAVQSSAGEKNIRTTISDLDFGCISILNESFKILVVMLLLFYF